jgi:hypothetical protein
MSPTERLAEAARILAKGVVRFRQAENQASKTDLRSPTRQSEVCGARAGNGNRTPVAGIGDPPAQ